MPWEEKSPSPQGGQLVQWYDTRGIVEDNREVSETHIRDIYAS